MAHTLKSTAGNIGARTLYDACQQLETACTECKNEILISDKLKQVSSILDSLIPFLEMYENNHLLNNKKTPKTTKTIEIKQYYEKFTTLQELLSEDDPDALEILDSLVNDFSSTAYSVQLDKIKFYASDYEFDEALSLLEKLLSDIYDNSDNTKIEQ